MYTDTMPRIGSSGSKQATRLPGVYNYRHPNRHNYSIDINISGDKGAWIGKAPVMFDNRVGLESKITGNHITLWDDQAITGSPSYMYLADSQRVTLYTNILRSPNN